MSFHREAKRVRNETLSIGLRYMSFRHCVQLYSPFGFQRTWRILAKRFGVKEGAVNLSRNLITALKLLEKDRVAWIRFQWARRELAQVRRRAGLLKPEIRVKHR